RERALLKKGSIFMPEAVDAFLEISGNEYVWLDAVYEPLLYVLPTVVSFDVLELDIDGILDLTKIFASIIDFRDPFTQNHSAGVAETAKKLAELAGFSENECKMMFIAGNLHDLGKLAVDQRILHKPGSLNTEERNVMRSHSFYTYRLLQTIRGFETINKWASFHHEKLNGKGYPFHLHSESIPLGSRIMAVADIFTAVTEDRPYRKALSLEKASAILSAMVKDGSLCSYVVSLLLENIEMVDEARRDAQQKAKLKYHYVMKPVQ
ncbi:MAG TPA: HD domain-containing phosphohydrolase, partial [Oscillospiraceae bacterium]|nr:HD domain-containing phosphohydrolase [Oscillospiraceae bacterium]